MSDQLNRCYYEGMSLSEAVKMLESSYGTKISDRVIKNAKAKILKQNNQIWVQKQTEQGGNPAQFFFTYFYKYDMIISVRR